MAKIMQPEAMPLGNLHSGCNRSFAQVVRHKHGGGQGNPPIRFEGRKHKIRVLPVRRSGAPSSQMTGKPGMQRNVPV